MLGGKMYPNMMYLLLKGRLEISTGGRVIRILISEFSPKWPPGFPSMFSVTINRYGDDVISHVMHT